MKQNVVNKKLNKKFAKGFTLLELLVVVLIIGILASIALPQYQGAVRKARVAEAKLALRALSDAADRYILQHGDSNWDSLEDLDVQVPEETNNWDIYVDDCDGDGCLFYAVPKRGNYDYDIEYAGQGYEGGNCVKCGKFICWSNNDKGKKICQQLGGKQIDDEGYSDSYQL